jgi:hypothetical protein
MKRSNLTAARRTLSLFEEERCDGALVVTAAAAAAGASPTHPLRVLAEGLFAGRIGPAEGGTADRRS